jgi:hypothetical protein
MKKMLFSAIALVAFIATSMAGEIEENNSSKQIEAAGKDCCKLQSDVYDIVRANGGDSQAANAAAYAAYNACVKETKKVTSAN